MMAMRRIVTTASALAITLCLLPLGTVQAMPMAYTDFAAFSADLPGPANTLNFEGQPAGELIGDGNTVGGITFNYPGLAGFGVTLAVTDGNQFGGGGPFSTTSGSNFLGSDDADILQSGDDFNLGLGPVNAIGMYFLSVDPVLDDDIVLTVGTTTASLAVADLQQTLADGSSVYFLGIIDTDATFNSADISSFCCGAFLFNIDDIVTATVQNATNVPEPNALLLMGAGLVLVAGAATRRRDRLGAGRH